MSILALHRAHRIRRRPSLLARLLAADANWRERRDISRLSDETLRDIGLTRADLDAQAHRSAWSAPAHWRRDR